MPKDLVEGCMTISVREIPKDEVSRTTWGGFVLTSTTPRFGGLRYWFLCPRCGRRVGKLYHVERWACRRCLNLAYQSQRLSRHPILRGFQLLDRADALVARYQAGDESVLGKLVKLRDQMLRELAQQQAEGSTQIGDAGPECMEPLPLSDQQTGARR